jgi:hypothetical protein
MTLVCTAMIVAGSFSARNLVHSGLVARCSKVTLSEGLPAATLRAGPFWPIAASLVGHYAKAQACARAGAHFVLSPRFLHSAKIGSVMVMQPNVIPL